MNESTYDPITGRYTQRSASGTSVASAVFPFDHTMLPSLAAGVDTGILLPVDAVLGYGAIAISIQTAFNGTTPFVGVAATQAYAVSEGLGVMAYADAAVADTDAGGNAWQVQGAVNVSQFFIVRGSPAHIWVALTDNASGNPGSTAGVGSVVVTWSEPV